MNYAKEAIKDFYRYVDADKSKLKKLLECYRWQVKVKKKSQRKVNTGLGDRGQPLRAITLKHYKRKLEDYTNSSAQTKKTIKMLVNHGVMGRSRIKRSNVVAFHPYVIEREAEEKMKKEQDMFERNRRELEAEHPGMVAHIERMISRGFEQGFSSTAFFALFFRGGFADWCGSK